MAVHSHAEFSPYWEWGAHQTWKLDKIVFFSSFFLIPLLFSPSHFPLPLPPFPFSCPSFPCPFPSYSPLSLFFPPCYFTLPFPFPSLSFFFPYLPFLFFSTSFLPLSFFSLPLSPFASAVVVYTCCRFCGNEGRCLDFYPPSAMLSRVLAVVVCLCLLCLCLSVCLTHAGIVSKRLNIASFKLRHVIAQGL